MNENLKKIHDLLDANLTKNPAPAPAGGPGVMFAWNNFYGSWSDGGWNNFYGSWSDAGWNNFYGSWSDSGWNNFYGSWGDGSSGGGGGGCFLTTACVQYKNLPDNCYELEVLRAMRDSIVEWDEETRQMVLEYYRIAPQIVSAIDASGHGDEVYERLYNELVLPCVKFYENQQIKEAVRLYVDTVNALKTQYLQA